MPQGPVLTANFVCNTLSSYLKNGLNNEMANITGDMKANKWLEFRSMPSSPKKSPCSAAFVIAADSVCPFPCIHECNLHNTISQQPYAFHSAE